MYTLCITVKDVRYLVASILRDITTVVSLKMDKPSGGLYEKKSID